MPRLTPALLVGAALAALTSAAEAQETALCHYDNPAPYETAMADPERQRGDPEPACAEEVNAAETPEELVLPLPCGHRLYFRRVDVPVRDVLAHTTVHVGDANAASRRRVQNRISSIPRAVPLSGAFFTSGAEPGAVERSFYYIQKYEMTAAQWNLFTEGLLERPVAETLQAGAPACAAHEEWRARNVRPNLILPATRISWFDAHDFSRAFNAWVGELDRLLIENGRRPRMPWSAGSAGFLRLPAEIEWEYAARGGGSNVSRDALNRRFHPVWDGSSWVEPATLEEIAAIEGLRPPEIQVAGIGKRAPNPVGLYDTLGNAEELVLDLFRPTRNDGFKGQFGGAVLRGGSTATDRELIGLGYRQEAPLFDRFGELRSDFVGVRFALSAPFFVAGFDETAEFPYAQQGLANEEQIEAIRRALTALSAEADLPAGDGTGSIEDLEIRAEEAGLAPRAEALFREAAQIARQARTERIQVERDLVQERFISAATLLVGTDRTGANLFQAYNLINQKMGEVDTMPMADRSRLYTWLRSPSGLAQMDVRAREIDALFSSYVENVTALIDAPEEDRRVALTQATEWMAQREVPRLQTALGQLTQHVRQGVANNRSVGIELREEWLYEVDSFRARREQLRRAVETALSQ